MNTARMIFGEFSASHRMTSTMTTVPIAFGNAPSCKVANSSSWIATGPVSRTRAWYSVASSRSAAVLRIASVAALSGLERLVV